MVTMNPADRLEKLRIGDIMIPIDDYPRIGPQTTLREAMLALERAQLEVDGRKSLPRVLLVMDGAGKLLGTVRRRDIMRGLEPRHLVSQPLNYRKKLFDVSVDPNLAELSHDKTVNGIREQAGRQVREVMRPIEVAIETRDHIIKGIYEMVGYGLTLLPVLEAGRVVGVVRSVELFRELSYIVLGEDIGKSNEE